MLGIGGIRRGSSPCTRTFVHPSELVAYSHSISRWGILSTQLTIARALGIIGCTVAAIVEIAMVAQNRPGAYTVYFVFIPLALLGVRSIDHEMLFASQSFGDANLNNASRSR